MTHEVGIHTNLQIIVGELFQEGDLADTGIINHCSDRQIDTVDQFGQPCRQVFYVSKVQRFDAHALVIGNRIIEVPGYTQHPITALQGHAQCRQTDTGRGSGYDHQLRFDVSHSFATL